MDLSFISNELCKLDEEFPPNELWVEYYNEYYKDHIVKDLRDLITITNNKKKNRYYFIMRGV